MIEDVDGYENIKNENYMSVFKPQAFYGSLNSLSIRYGFNYIFIKPELAGHFLYSQFYHYLRNWLLNKIYK